MSSTDRPADDIIENDEKLDQWMKAFMRKAAQRSGRTGGDAKFDMNRVVEQATGTIIPPGA